MEREGGEVRKVREKGGGPTATILLVLSGDRIIEFGQGDHIPLFHQVELEPGNIGRARRRHADT